MTEHKLRPTRYAHLDGHTDVAYSTDGKQIITGGVDGEVRIFEGLDDDDCVTHTLADCVHGVAYMDGSILVATDQNMVQSYTIDKGQPNGIISRFTDAPTHITVCKARNFVAMGSSDMTIKVAKIKDFSEIVLMGHEAPVLSVAIDSQGEFLASASCDGSVRIWDLVTKKEIHKMDVLNKCSDFSFADSICRLSWTPNDKFIIVPIKNMLAVFARHSWTSPICFLKHGKITEALSVTCVSPCGRYVACGSQLGRIAVFSLSQKSCIVSVKSPHGVPITGMKWNPAGKTELAYVTSSGQLGTFTDFIQTQSQANEKPMEVVEHEEQFPPIGIDVVPDDEDDAEFSISKIKQQLGFADDEEGTFLGLPDQPSEIQAEEQSRPLTPQVTHPPKPTLPVPQRAFQPGMSPEHLAERYMLWNDVGIIRQYSNDEENSVNVEFHNTSVHYPLSLENHYNHTMAALNEEVLVLAAESRDDQASKLVVRHLASRGGNKEWETDMPSGEEIVALAVGQRWIAVGTDAHNLRVFSSSGMQRDVICIPGQIVCIAGQSDMVFVVFHSGIGAGGDQQMSSLVFSLSGSGHLVPIPSPVPLSPGSYLSWAGFTDEGSPIIVDSSGIVKQLHFIYGTSWTPILNTKSHTKGKSDNYFVIGASEAEGKVRCILCKGSLYPPVLPQPHVSLLETKIPMCEPESEKSSFEQSTIKMSMLSRTLEKLGQNGFDVAAQKSDAEKSITEVMIKMFALSCRSDRDTRAYEICELMPTYQAVKLAIKYAAKLEKLRLAERLGEIAERKMEEDLRKQQQKEEQFMESLFEQPTGYQQETVGEPSKMSSKSPETFENSNETEGGLKYNPLYEAAMKKAKNASNVPLPSPIARNPFRKNSTSDNSLKGFNALDLVKVGKRKSEETSILRPVMKKPKTSRSNSMKITEKENTVVSDVETPKSTKKENTTDNVVQTPKSTKKKSAVQLWLDDNKEHVKNKFPDVPESALFVKAAMMFKDVDDETKQKYKHMAQQSTTDPSQPEEEKPKTAANKLKAFAFSGTANS